MSLSVDLKIKDLVETDIPSGSAEVKVSDALNLMIQKRVNIFVVVNKDKKIKGVFTLYDILDRLIPFFIKIDTSLGFISTNELITEERIRSLSNLRAKDLMVKKVYCLKEEEEMIKAIIMMYVKNFDYIPVINKEHQLVGVVNRTNVEKKIIEIINSFS
ncbi:MAG: CBS domain-containing protein [Patescibacteria group bacterium]|nr:CBS domain-containing protein [Patescibacteria group bacterium]